MVFAEEPSALVGAAARTSRVREAAPASTVPYGDGYLGLAGLCISWLFVMVIRPQPVVGAWVVLLGTALPMLAAELRRAPASPERRRQFLAPPAWAVGFVLATLPFLAYHAQASDAVNWTLAWLV